MRALTSIAGLTLAIALGGTLGMLGMNQPAYADSRDKAGPATPATTLIELYTSQGCSSCPPADALLESYASRPDVVALTLPVDYWDYLGWKDTLANPKFSMRQRAYARERGDGRIYTPQVVVNGLRHVVGSRASEIDRAIAETTPLVAANRVAVRIRSADGHLVIDLAEAAPGAREQEATVWLALIRRKVDVEIGRGENRGRKITYFNVVREWTPVGTWNGKSATIQLAHHAVQQSGAEGCAVIVQKGKAGAVLGTALLKSW